MVKIQILGIAVILFGLVWYITLSGISFGNTDVHGLGTLISCLGLVITIIGTFKQEKK
jgi:hypothetical protein